MHQNTALRDKLEALRDDYARATGAPFDHFYCPILYRDEAVQPCVGHVVPQSIERASSAWTVQRKDVDNLFGTLFESDFELLQTRGKHSLVEILADKDLAKKLRPSITADGEHVRHYAPGATVPEQHSRVEISDGTESVDLALKLTPSELVQERDRQWEIGYQKDLRLAALVSLLKAAHLTMFTLLGYRYALSAGGHFVGRRILGDYVESIMGLDRSVQLDAAEEHFAEFTSMVRPILGDTGKLEGTVDDQALKLVGPIEEPLGLLVTVRTGDSVHGVLVPVLEGVEAAVWYDRFLNGRVPKVETRRAEYRDAGWVVSPTSSFIDWPPAKL